MKWTSIPFFRFTMALIAGILFYIHAPFLIHSLFFFNISLFLYILLFFISSRKRLFHKFKPYLGFTALLTLFFFGTLIARMKDEKNDASHLINLDEKIEYYEATAVKNAEERDQTFRTEIRLNKIKTTKGWIPAKGKILLYTQKENFIPLKYGNQLLIKGSPKLTQAPANPFEFDYKSYLRYHQIHHTHFVRATQLMRTGYDPPSRFADASVIVREKAHATLRKFIRGEDEFKIAAALILGVRSSLDNDLKNSYSSTGTMHVLAVSGLHVGIILGMLMMLLKFLPSFSLGRIFIPVLLIIILWMYAFITGFSASVLRAVVMFSLVIAAQSLKRNTSIYNTLALSAFILLCIDPFFLMDAGFQLSFLAVFGIVFFQPKIYSLFVFKNTLADKAWLLTSVSIAAQLSTFPLTLYYFHQFPLNFILSNLIAIPLSFGVLYAGILLLVFSWVPGLNAVLGWVTEKGIGLMNQLIFIIEDIPFSVIKNIDLDLPEILAVYMMILFISAFLVYKKNRYLKVSVLILLYLTIIQTREILQQKNQKEFISFSIRGHTALGFVKANRIDILADSSLIGNKQKQQFHIYPYLIQNGINEVNFHNIKNSTKELNLHVSDSISVVCFQGKSFGIHLNTSSKLPENFKTDFTISLQDNRKKAIAYEASLAE